MGASQTRAFVAATVALLLSQNHVAVAEVSKEVIEHVKCPVCELVMKEAVTLSKERNLKDEDGLADFVDGLCTMKKPEGKWTARHDIVRRDPAGPLTLELQEGIGKCKSECLALQRACNAVLKNKDETIVSMLMAGKSEADLKTKICKKVCSKKLSPLKNWVDEPYWMRDPKEVEAEERVAKMEAETGQKYKMWHRDEIASMSQADIELEAAKDALGAQRREARLAAEAEASGPRVSLDSEL